MWLANKPHKLWKGKRELTGTRTNGVDTNAIPYLLVAQSPGEGHNGALRARVVEKVRAADVRVYRGAGDDGVAAGHVREGVFGQEEERMDIRIEGLNPLFPIGVSAPQLAIQRDKSSTHSVKSPIVSCIIWKPWFSTKMLIAPMSPSAFSTTFLHA